MKSSEPTDMFARTSYSVISAAVIVAAAMFIITFSPEDDSVDAASSGTCGDDLTWVYTESDRTLTISGSGDMDDYVLSSTVPWHCFCDDICTISLPERLTHVGDFAFCDFSALTSADIPSSVLSLGKSAFSGCSSLTSIALPPFLTSLDDGVFYECSSLRAVDIPETVVYIGEGAFYGDSSLLSVSVPSKVTSICDWTFRGCTSLESIIIPGSVTSIGSSAFSGCSSLESIAVPAKVTSIGYNAFSGCSSLAGVADLTGLHISPGEYGLSDDVEVVVPDSVGWGLYSYIIGSTLYFTGHGDMCWFALEDRPWHSDAARITTIDFSGSTIKSINNNAFRGFSSLTDIKWSDSLVCIGSYAFYKCTSLKTINIPDSVTSVKDHAFSNCYSVTSLSISSSLTFLSKYVFSDCISLASVTVPDSVNEICDHAFANCCSLKFIILPSSVTSMGYDLFSQCIGITIINCTSIEIGWEIYGGPIGDANVVNAYRAGGSLYGYVLDGTLYFTGSGAMYDWDGPGSTPWCGVSSQIKAVDLSGSYATSVGSFAFGGLTSLTHVVWCGTIKEIGGNVFAGSSSLKCIEVPSSVTSIDDSAFSGSSVKTVYDRSDLNILPGKYGLPDDAEIIRCP